MAGIVACTNVEHLLPQQLSPLMNQSTITRKEKNLLRSIAIFEIVKGISALAAGLGLLSLAHHDLKAMAYALIGHFHLDPESHYPQLLIDKAMWLESANLRQIVLLACLYASIRLIEAYGLWKDKAWAEWLAACSGGIYLPIEISHLYDHTTWINAAVMLFNLGVVMYMIYRLWERRKTA